MVQYCTFFVNDHFFGVDVLHVHEIIKYQEMTKVPLSHDVVEGLINLRGQIVTAIDLRKRLNFTELGSESDLPANVVLRVDDGLLSFLVDEIGDVIELSETGWEATPASLRDVFGDLISCVYKYENELLLVIDIDQAIDLES